MKNLFGDEFVWQLKGRGVDAVASYTVVLMNELMDENIVRGKIRKLGMEWVIVTRPVDIRRVRAMFPARHMLSGVSTVIGVRTIGTYLH